MIWNLQKFTKNTAIVTEDREISYHELEMNGDFITSKIGRRCLLFLLCKNTEAAISVYISSINHNIVPVMIDADLDKEFILQLSQIYGPAYFWLPSEKSSFVPNCKEICASWGYTLLENLDTINSSLNPNLALLMTTSGSTGSPKLVRQSYENIVSNTKSIIKYLNIDEKERAITNLPLHYVYGLSIVQTHLYSGGSLVVTEKSLFQKDFWELFRKYNVTSLAGVPYTYEILNRLRFFKMELPSLKMMTQAGGKLLPELHKKFAQYAEDKQKNFIVMYGAAEATARMGYLPAKDALQAYGKMGCAIPEGDFELHDENDKIIEEIDTVGELVYYGKNVTMGYAACSEDLMADDENKGKLYTGDLARRGNDGYYTIVGRKKRFLKIFGKRTNLDEVEAILKKQFMLSELACAGIDDKLYIFTTDETIKDTCVPYISKKLGIHPLAFKAMVISKIPKNKAGKIMYRCLEKYYDRLC